MSKIRHENSGNCDQCEKIFNRYAGFNGLLKAWFKGVQKRNPAMHISCAGRGELDQEAAVINKTSRAHWKESAHNYNCAIDLFELQGDTTNIYEREFFEKVLKIELEDYLTWYGAKGSEYYELPHVELKMWKTLLKLGKLKLVE